MSKYLHKITTQGDQDNIDVQQCKDKKCINGDSIIFLKSPRDGQKLHFVKHKDERDTVTKFTWDIRIEDDGAYIDVVFSGIHKRIISDSQLFYLCIESNNLLIKQQRKKKRGMYKRTYRSRKISSEIYFSEIEVGKTYTFKLSYNDIYYHMSRKTAHYHNRYRPIPNDWVCKLNIRPAIISKKGLPYKNFKNQPEYRYVEIPYNVLK